MGSGSERLARARWEKISQPYGVAAHPIKRGALAHAAGAAVERDLDPRILTQLGRHADPLELPHRTVSGTLDRHFEQLREVDGPHVESARDMAKLPCALQRSWGKIRRQDRFLMGAAFWDALRLPERPLRRNSGDCLCRRWMCGRCWWCG
ncbi:hypothetical protein TRVL_09161 [Trypanosoma vivax]|nr:hypothetical protein TRVL_09161 [Trypanosoma vivax]